MRLTADHPAATQADPEVLFDVCHHVGMVTLNRPRQLNALSWPMIGAIAERLRQWAADDNVRAVLLRGAGPKGFCAGGDIRALYDSYHAGTPLHRDFFADEYRLDFALHRYPKPVVALMDGVVMGGGMGLAQAASLRIVTERSRVAMPETGIGLVPDVGASHFLSKMPVELALYIGLTGVTLGAADALLCGLADVAVDSAPLADLADPTDLCARLAAIDWTRPLHEALRRALAPDPVTTAADAPLLAHLPAVLRHFRADASLPYILASLAADNSDWAAGTLAVLRSRSPLMTTVTRELLLRGRRMDLADCFEMERDVVTHAFVRGDFIEGVRALIVDKDQRPRWRVAAFGEVTAEQVAGFFSAPRPVACAATPGAAAR